MKTIWIVGAGGFACELFAWLQCCLDDHTAQFCGFLDDYAAETSILQRIGASTASYQTAPLSNYIPKTDDVFLCGFGTPQQKEKILPELELRGFQFMNLVHTSVIMGANVRIGKGTIICPGVILTSNIEIGEYAMLNIGAKVGHDVTIGNYSVIAPNAALLGKTRVGNCVTVGANSVTYMGSTIEDYATVGISSAVLKKASAFSTCFGVPAKTIFTKN